MEISKRDWMLYREKIADWQENYMNQWADVTSTFPNHKGTIKIPIWKFAKYSTK